EDKANAIMGAIHDKLNDDWFNNTSEDEDDLEGILDYLEPRSYDGFINLEDEAYNVTPPKSGSSGMSPPIRRALSSRLKLRYLTKLFHISLHDLNRLFNKTLIFINLDLFQRYLNIWLSQALLEVRHMKVSWIQLSSWGTGYSLKDKNEAKTDKTEHGIGKSVKKSKVKVKSQQVKDEAEQEEI
ncbi:hypothetical protein Tco_1258334, partial [Tanacetum coccineum]